MIGPGDREGEGLRVKGPFRGARHNSRLERTGSAPAAQPGRWASKRESSRRFSKQAFRKPEVPCLI